MYSVLYREGPLKEVPLYSGLAIKMHLAILQYIAYLRSRQISGKEPEATLSLETAIELIMIPGYKVCE